MFKSQLIIGLGGVGGSSIAAFKRNIELHKRDYTKLVDKGYRFEYLYIDSNDDRLNDSRWEVYGRSVKLNEADVVMLKRSGEQDIPISVISKHPRVRPWIGDLKSAYSKRTGKTDIVDSAGFNMAGAGQLRRYGRALFAINTDIIRNVLRKKLRKLTEGAEGGVDVHIFCTLGGGTGSGSIVDMVTLIQDLAVGGHNYQTYIYTFVAGKLRDTQDTGSFYQNEYATLRDLNALMVCKNFCPFIAAGADPGSEDCYFDHNKHEVPIRRIYLSSEESLGTPDLNDQIEFMAKACFDTMVCYKEYAEGHFKKALDGEDFVSNAEDDGVDGIISGSRRSYRFASLGIKRLCIPTEEIKELLRQDCAKRVFESWRDGSPMNLEISRDWESAKHEISHPSRTRKWIESEEAALKDEVRKYYEAIVKQGRRDASTLKDLREKAWQVKEAASELMKNSSIKVAMRKIVGEDARDTLQSLQEMLDQRMRWIRIESDKEVWGLKDVSEFISTEYLKWVDMYTSSIAPFIEPEKIKNEKNSLEKNMDQREEEWRKLGFLTIHLTEKDERMIKNHYDDCCSLLEFEFRQFRSKAMDMLKEDLNEIVSPYRSKVEVALQENKNKISDISDRIKNIVSGLSTNSTSSSMGGDQYVIDRENLENVRKKITKLDKTHHECMASIFDGVWKMSINSLRDFHSGATQKLEEKVKERLDDYSNRIHEIARREDSSLKSVLLNSIVERLLQIAAGGDAPESDCEDWERNKELDKIITDFLRNFRSSVGLSGTGLTEGGNSSPIKAIAIGFPEEIENNPQFKEWLKKKLCDTLGTNYSTDRNDFYKHETAGEIRVLHLQHWFPARFATVVRDIYAKYENTAKKPNEAFKIYFANIDDNDIGLESSARPSLLPELSPKSDS